MHTASRQLYTDFTEGYEPFQVQYNTTKHIYSISRATIAVHKMTGSTVHTTPISLMSDEAQQYLTVKLNTGVIALLVFLFTTLRVLSLIYKIVL